MNHGTQSAYRYHGCRCDLCKTAQRRYAKLRALGRAGLVDAAPITALFQRLHEESWSDADIAAACGGHVSRIRELRHGRQSHVRVATFNRIMGTRFDRRQPGSRVPNVGTRRRLQALARMGWTIRMVAAECGLPESTLGYAATSNTTVWQSTHDAVAAVYDRISGTVGPSQLGRTRAANAGWAPPLAWDDIDDPDEVPELRTDDGPRVLPVEDVAELVAQGLDQYQIGERLGWHHDTVRKAMRRMERAS